MITSARILANPKKKDSLKIKKEVEEFLRVRGIKVLKNGDILITIGGDGTILHNKKFYSQPIFSIGSKRSFICQANEKNWRKKLSNALTQFKIDERSLLASELNGKRLQDALNEVFVRVREHRLLSFKLHIDKKIFEFRGDGVIFSTPTGSTAYAYSCGGRELDKHAKKYEIVPIAPYRRTFKPMVISDKKICLLEVDGEYPVDVVIDGQFVHKMKRKNFIKVYKSEKKVRFLC